MRFRQPDYVVLVVENLDRALAFYTSVLGLELGHRSGPFAQLATGATRLALFERAAMAETLAGFGERLARVERTLAELKALLLDLRRAR